MNLEELLAPDARPTKDDLTEEDFAKLLRKYRGILKARERDTAFWEATNENLKIAYGKLDEKDRELARAYATIQEDLMVGSQVQRALLPKASAKMQGELDIAVYHKQLAEVGGTTTTSSGRRTGNTQSESLIYRAMVCRPLSS